MKKALILGVFAVVMLALVGGCTTFTASGLEFHDTPTAGERLGDFDINVKVNRFLGSPGGGATLANLFQDSIDPAVTDAIRKEISSRGGTAAINVKIVQQQTPVQVILNYILAYVIYSPVTLHITGTVIR